METEQAIPVVLDITSMKDDVILLLDTFFYVCIWKGKTIHSWEKAGYHKNEGYENFAGLLEAPQEDAKYILSERFPYSRFYVTHPDDTNERKIKVKVNPAPTSSATNLNNVEELYGSEDVSLTLFMQHLVRMAV